MDPEGFGQFWLLGGLACPLPGRFGLTRLGEIWLILAPSTLGLWPTLPILALRGLIYCRLGDSSLAWPYLALRIWANYIGQDLADFGS